MGVKPPPPGKRKPVLDHPHARGYNAVVAGVRHLHDDLLRLTVVPDFGQLDFEAGQYTVLGMGGWEPRLAGCQEETLDEAAKEKMILRAYSISSPIFDDGGDLWRSPEHAELEFYITIVRFAAKHPPALTPRLFLLKAGDRLHVGPKAHGHYSLAPVGPDDTVIFAATGTGEAPHNAMLVELLSRGHKGRIFSLVCARHRRDLGYLAEHRRLEAMFPQYRYLPLTTREPENLDPTLPGYVGKRYLQDYIASGDFEREAGVELTPEGTHCFLCGSPDMIGAPQHMRGQPAEPPPRGMVAVLEARGFRVDHPGERGNIHFEKYW